MSQQTRGTEATAAELHVRRLAPTSSDGDGHHHPGAHDHGAADDHHHEDVDYGPTGLDVIELISAGIDIGSATFQTLFSRIRLERMGRELSSRFVVVERETLYRSPRHLTPYSADGLIDQDSVTQLLAQSFTAAALEPHQIGSGTVLLTGEALRRENSRAIADRMAELGGAFMCVAAGHHMEAQLAAHGSHAVALSAETGQTVLNIDIGGGTTKFALVTDGQIAQTAALHVGGRLAAFDEDGTIVRLESAGARYATECGFDWTVGARASEAEITAVGHHLADMVSVAAGFAPGCIAADLWLTQPLPTSAEHRPSHVVISGGVASYVDDAGIAEEVHDLGRAVAAALATQLKSWPVTPSVSDDHAQATVIGASQHTVQVSGNTIFLPKPSLLPITNLLVVHTALELAAEIDADDVAEAVERELLRHRTDDGDWPSLAVALRWTGMPSYARLAQFARGIEAGTRTYRSDGRPLLVLLDADVARLVGSMLQSEAGLGDDVVVLDGVELKDFDHIDIGAVLQPAGAVPVTVKSILFGSGDGIPEHEGEEQ